MKNIIISPTTESILEDRFVEATNKSFRSLFSFVRELANYKKGIDVAKRYIIEYAPNAHESETNNDVKLAENTIGIYDPEKFNMNIVIKNNKKEIHYCINVIANTKEEMLIIRKVLESITGSDHAREYIFSLGVLVRNYLIENEVNVADLDILRYEICSKS